MLKLFNTRQDRSHYGFLYLLTNLLNRAKKNQLISSRKDISVKLVQTYLSMLGYIYKKV